MKICTYHKYEISTFEVIYYAASPKIFLGRRNFILPRKLTLTILEIALRKSLRNYFKTLYPE